MTMFILSDMFPHLQCLLMDSRQTFVVGEYWDKDELIRFLGGRKVKVTLSQRTG